ncbi:MAG: coproporphyrinogen III oxidase, partial [Bacteroidia bacterium]
SNYWKGVGYLGLGPSAHSFDGNSRQWSVSSNSSYINSLQKNILPFEKEVLTEAQRYNEYVLTSLRTMWGTDLNYIRNKFPQNYLSHFLKETEKYIPQNLLRQEEEKILLSDKGKLFADKIAGDLFFIPVGTKNRTTN